MRCIALIGSGALATIFARELTAHFADHYVLGGIYSKTFEHAQKLALATGSTAFESFEDLMAMHPDIVVEFAGIGAVKMYAKEVVACGSDFVMASAGALADETFKEELEEIARLNNAKIYVAGGAIGGLDLMQTMAVMRGARATITSTKAPKSLNGAPYLKGEVLPEDQDVEVFAGGVKEAIAGFPKNVNVAVTTALASACPLTVVKLVSTPKTATNSHHITVTNALMRADICVQAKPDPANPKSSVSTAYSVLALLKNLASPLVFY